MSQIYHQYLKDYKDQVYKAATNMLVSGQLFKLSVHDQLKFNVLSEVLYALSEDVDSDLINDFYKKELENDNDGKRK